MRSRPLAVAPATFAQNVVKHGGCRNRCQRQSDVFSTGIFGLGMLHEYKIQRHAQRDVEGESYAQRHEQRVPVLLLYPTKNRA
jgi:hypothetical protein